MELKENFDKYVSTLGISETDEIYGLLYKAYIQGDNDSYKNHKEISVAEIRDWLDTNDFLEEMKKINENPKLMEELPKTSGLIELVMDCGGTEKCLAFPDNCDGLIDGKCHAKINLNDLIIK